jgi:hypothetical protein
VADTNSHPPGVRGRLSQLAGSLSNRVLEEVDADAVLEHVDIDALIARIDVDGLVARIDVDGLVARTDLDALVARVDPDALLERVDVDRLLDRVDVDRLLDRVDVDRLLDRVDVHRLLDRVDLDRVVAGLDLDAVVARVDLERALAGVDLERLVRQAGIPELVAESTGQVAGSALDLGRRQLVGLDVGISRFLHRLMRRDPDALPAGPPTLVADDRARIQAPDPEAARTKARFEVSGFYAGPVSRLVAFAGDVAVATSAFTAGVAALSWVLATLFGAQLPLAEDGGVPSGFSPSSRGCSSTGRPRRPSSVGRRSWRSPVCGSWHVTGRRCDHGTSWSARWCCRSASSSSASAAPGWSWTANGVRCTTCSRARPSSTTGAVGRRSCRHPSRGGSPTTAERRDRSRVIGRSTRRRPHLPWSVPTSPGPGDVRSRRRWFARGRARGRLDQHVADARQR